LIVSNHKKSGHKNETLPMGFAYGRGYPAPW